MGVEWPNLEPPSTHFEHLPKETNNAGSQSVHSISKELAGKRSTSTSDPADRLLTGRLGKCMYFVVRSEPARKSNILTAVLGGITKADLLSQTS